MNLSEGWVDIEKTMEFILAQQASAELRHAKADEDMAAIRTILAETTQIQRAQARTLVRLETSVAQLNESVGKLSEGFAKLTAAQEITEQKLQSFIDSLRRGHNGNPQAQ